MQQLIVYSLSTKVAVEQLGDDLEKLFGKFGTCYAKIKQGKKKDLPGAFVQFEVSFLKSRRLIQP